jgi:flagellar basal-body rod protein FlgG
MMQGIYTATAGMMAHDAIFEVITNNLANSATPGFRQDFATFTMTGDNPNLPRGAPQMPTLTFRAYTNFSPGHMKETANPFDLAFSDNGDNWFVIQTPRGLRFTRAGNFTLARDGTLVTMDNHPVLGAGGAIRINGMDVHVNDVGDVIVDGKTVDRIRVVQFDRINGRIPLEKEGYTLFRPISARSTPRSVPVPHIRQGFLEYSNVHAIDEMAEMINILRGYEAYQRSVQVFDGSLNTLIHRVGGV